MPGHTLGQVAPVHPGNAWLDKNIYWVKGRFISAPRVISYCKESITIVFH